MSFPHNLAAHFMLLTLSFLSVSFYLTFAVHATIYLLIHQLKFTSQFVVPQLSWVVQIWTPSQRGHTFSAEMFLLFVYPSQVQAKTNMYVFYFYSQEVFLCCLFSFTFFSIFSFTNILALLIFSFLRELRWHFQPSPISLSEPKPCLLEKLPLFLEQFFRGVLNFGSISQSAF